MTDTAQDLRSALERWESDNPFPKAPYGCEGWAEYLVPQADWYAAKATFIRSYAALAAPATEEPVDMLLFCPKCHAQHIDKPDLDAGFSDSIDGKARAGIWTNPPHRSHLCHACGCIWRPADVPTNGVEAIQTVGKVDNWTPAARSPAAEPVGLREALEAARDVIQMVEMFDKGTPLLTFVGQKQVERASALVAQALATPARTDDAAQAGGDVAGMREVLLHIRSELALFAACCAVSNKVNDTFVGTEAKAKEWVAYINSALSTQAAYPTGAGEEVLGDVIALVVAGRKAWEAMLSSDADPEACTALDKALERFASRVCYDDEGGDLPDAHANPCTCGSSLSDDGEGG